MNREAAVLIKEAQTGTSVDKEYRQAFVVDEIHMLNPSVLKRYGVKMDDLMVSQPNNRTETLDVLKALVKQEHSFIVLMLEQDFPRLGVGLFNKLFKEAQANKTSVVDLTWAMETE